MAVKMRPARMSSAEYWRRRESQRRKERIADEKERAKLLQEIYRSAVDQMTREVESFFQRYARDEQITLADARRRVSLLDMKEYERLAKQYVESKDFSPEANRQMKLYNLTMKANRLELLRNRLGLEMVKMTNDTQTEISRALVERSLETFEEYAGILGESVRDPLALAATISQEPFKGAKWSERLWGTNQKGLYDSVTRTLENALISGKNAKQLASSIQKQYGRSLYEAERLMVTEMARCQTEAAKLSMEANENEYYMVLTANAMGPCGDCSDLEDQTTRDPIPVKDMEPGVNAPPLHPSCHCATAPWWDEGKYQEWLNSGAAKEGMAFAEFEADTGDKNKIEADASRLRSKFGAYIPTDALRQEIIKRGIAEKRPIFADGNLGKLAYGLPQKEGWYDVVLHGWPHHMEFFGQNIDVETLCAIIAQRKDYRKGTPIRLISCYTGSEEDGIAQYIANKLHVDVEAPDKKGIISKWLSGNYEVYSGSEKGKHDGNMIVFHPKETQVIKDEKGVSRIYY